MHVQILASLFQNDFFCKISSFLDMYLILVITFFCSCNSTFVFALLYRAEFYCSVHTLSIMRTENANSLITF